MIQQIKWYFLVIIFSTLNLHVLDADETANSSESTTSSIINTSTSSDLEENKDTENITSPPEHTTESQLDTEPLNKYRRNGLDIEYADKWEDADRKRYMIDFTNQFEDDLYPYRERARFNDKIFPVRIQGCPHYSRDVSRDEGFIRSGILQGWLGAARGTGSRNSDDKRLEMSPFYVTTAIPKTAPSYRNHANSNKPYANYENNYDNQSGGGNYGQNRHKYSENYKVKGSASKDYYNVQNGNYVSDERNVNSWQFPQGKNNNRLIYYEYNLDDNRRPDSGYYSGGNNFMNYNQCDGEYEENSRRPTKNNYFNGNRYQQSSYGNNLVPQSRFSTNANQDLNDKEYGSYYSEDAGYQSRNIDRADHRNTGYEFNSPFNPVNNDKPYFPSLIPPTLSTPRTQFMAESGSVIRNKDSVKSIPFTGHKFNFHPSNI